MSSPRPGLSPLFVRSNRKMEESVTPLSVLGPQCEAQRERIRKLFDSGATAQDTLRQLCELADNSIQKVFVELLRVREYNWAGTLLAGAWRLRSRNVVSLFRPGFTVPVRQRESGAGISPVDCGIFAHTVGSWLSRQFGRTNSRRMSSN